MPYTHVDARAGMDRQSMLDTTTVFVMAAAATMFAGISKGGFGSGAAFASSAFLALILPPAQALGLMLPLLMLIDIGALKSFCRRWNRTEAGVMILGAAPGVGLGAALFSVANDTVLRLLIGGVAIGFVIWRLWPARGLRKPPLWTGVLSGIAAGFTSFVSHAGGPPAAIYLLARGLDKTTYQATTVLVFWVINLTKAVPYAFLGVFTREGLMADLWLAPFALIGTWLGVRAHHMVPEKLFFALTYVMLMITGCKLIWDSLA